MYKKIIVAGHICLDITPVFDSARTYQKVSELLVPGKLLHMKHADVHTGGCVANTGLALKKLGADVTLMGKTGADTFGDLVLQVFKRYDADGLLIDENSSTSYTVILAIPGVDRIFLHNPGANDTFYNRDIPDECLSDAALFHFGYPPLMRSMYENEGEELLTIFKRMKEQGIATSLDLAAVDPNSDAGKANWKNILEKVLPYVDIFVPSFEELCYMLDPEKFALLSENEDDIITKIDIERDVVPLAEKVLALGCPVVMIKCGTAGMYYQTADAKALKRIGERLALNTSAWADRKGIQPCYKANEVLSATGAGDTSIAAFLAALIRGKNPEECVALAAAEGSCCVTTYDALSGLKSLEELEERIHAGWTTLS